MTGGGTENALSLREHANAIGCDLHLAHEEESVTLNCRSPTMHATACGAFADLQSAAASMVRPGATIRADPAQRAFHDAKYAVYLAMYQDWCGYRRVMHRATPPTTQR